jgi:anti-anti-sigma factor
MHATPRAAAGHSLSVEGELTIYTATAWKAALLDALGHGQVVELDLAGVTEIDTAGIQLLLQARRAGAAGHPGVRLCAPSPAVSEAMALLELGPTLLASD